MKYLAFHGSAFVGAALIAFVVAYLAHAVLGVPRQAIRIDALGMAACLAAFIGAAMFAQRRG
jgi:membrane protein DedA with SNARE-associated domain